MTRVKEQKNGDSRGEMYLSIAKTPIISIIFFIEVMATLAFLGADKKMTWGVKNSNTRYGIQQCGALSMN